MSKVCKNCGSVFEDDANFCTQCGSNELVSNEAPQQEAPQQETPQQETPQQETPENNYYAPAPEVKKFDFKALLKKKALLGAIAGALVVVILLAIFIPMIFKGYKKAIDNYIDVSINGKVNKIEKLAPKEYWEYLEDEEEVDIDELIDELEEEWEDQEEYIEEQYGKRIKATYKVTKKKEVSKKVLKGIAEAIEDEYDIDSKKVKKVYDLKVKVTIKGSEDEDTNSAKLSVAKIGGSWYVINYYESGDEYNVSFAADSFI